jgi:hypothetical protein
MARWVENSLLLALTWLSDEKGARLVHPFGLFRDNPEYEGLSLKYIKSDTRKAGENQMCKATLHAFLNNNTRSLSIIRKRSRSIHMQRDISRPSQRHNNLLGPNKNQGRNHRTQTQQKQKCNALATRRFIPA